MLRDVTRARRVTVPFRQIRENEVAKWHGSAFASAVRSFQRVFRSGARGDMRKCRRVEKFPRIVLRRSDAE